MDDRCRKQVDIREGRRQGRRVGAKEEERKRSLGYGGTDRQGKGNKGRGVDNVLVDIRETDRCEERKGSVKGEKKGGMEEKGVKGESKELGGETSD